MPPIFSPRARNKRKLRVVAQSPEPEPSSLEPGKNGWFQLLERLWAKPAGFNFAPVQETFAFGVRKPPLGLSAGVEALDIRPRFSSQDFRST